MEKEIIFKTHEETCLSNINTGGGGTENERSAMNDAQEGINTTGSIINALIDGGDTETLNTEVESSTPPEAVQVYNDLMEESPNLSETVVESTIEKENVLPNPMVRDVMVANPHTAKSLQLLEQLTERSNPMPEYMIAQILTGRSIQSLKTELEGELARYRLQKARAINGLANLYKSNPEIPDVSDSLLALYQGDNSLHGRYMQAWLHLNRGEYTQAENVMNNIPVQLNLDEATIQEYQDMVTLLTLLKSVSQAGTGLSGLSEGQLSQVHTISSQETGMAAAYARNILIALDEISYDEPVLLPDHFKSAEAVEAYHQILDTEVPSVLEVFPNPGKDFVILAYSFGKEQQGSIEVQDMTGTRVHTQSFEGRKDQVTVNTANWTAGTYIMSLVVDGKTIESVKFNLVK